MKKKPYFYTPPLLIYRSILNREELSSVTLNIVTFHPAFTTNYSKMFRECDLLTKVTVFP